jgi:hypothetical protein
LLTRCRELSRGVGEPIAPLLVALMLDPLSLLLPFVIELAIEPGPCLSASEDGNEQRGQAP